MTKKIGIYGGTFSPPHIGHVGAAESFSRALPLDELLIVPDFLPPHKEFDGKTSAEDRMRMCELAFSHIKNVKFSDIEIKRGGKSYTALTLEELSGQEIELYFLCGTDMFITLNEWYSPKKIFDLATICYVRREEDKKNEKFLETLTEKYTREYGARVVRIPCDVKEISSTEVRTLLKSRGNLDGLLSKNVYDYIIEKGLYL